MPRVPDSSLGVSAPRLRSLHHTCISHQPCLSASRRSLVLVLGTSCPRMWPIASPRRLEELEVQLSSPSIQDDVRVHLLSHAASSLYSLHSFSKADHLLTHMDAPVLTSVNVNCYFNQSPAGRTETFEVFDQDHMYFDYDLVYIGLSSQTWTTDGKMLELSVACGDSGWQLSSLTHCTGSRVVRSHPPSPTPV